MRNLTRITMTVGLLVVSITFACRSSAPPTAGDQLEGLRSEIQKVVTDGERAQTMLAEVGAIERSMEELGQVVKRHSEELRAMAREYDTSREQLEKVLEGFLKERQEVAQELADAHYRLKAQATVEEWKKLAKKEKKALSWAAGRHLGELPLAEGRS
jgi:HAMP domain-containing protein